MADDIRNLPGLKRAEIKPCFCGQGVAHTGSPVFYRVRLEQFILDGRAVQRQHGLEMILGNPMIAAAMGPDEDMAKRVQSREVLLCDRCAMTLPVLALLDREEGEDA